MIQQDSVWLVTGCSKGFGRHLAIEALAAGHRVVATARRPADLEALATAGGDRLLPLRLDVTDAAGIAAAVAAAEARFGAIDVLVNNAGYGLLGAIEEGGDDDVRALFETDVFAPIALVKAVLPGMRARRRGHIVNIGSIGGIVSFAGVGYYNMAKFAIEGLSGALRAELAPLGIGVTVVEPGAFRTDFRGPDSMRQAATRIADYDATAGQARAGTQAGHGRQPGDPARGARAIVAAVTSASPPERLVLGSDALDRFRAHLASTSASLDRWESVSRSTDFAEAA